MFLTIIYWIFVMLYVCLSAYREYKPQFCDSLSCVNEFMVTPTWVFFPWIGGWMIATTAHSTLAKKWGLRDQNFTFTNRVAFHFSLLPPMPT